MYNRCVFSTAPTTTATNPHWAILVYKSSATSCCQKWKMKQESAARMRAQPLHLSIIKGLG